MVNLVKKIYRSLIPESTRYRILEARKKRRVEGQKQDILKYYKSLPQEQISSEVKDVLAWLEKNPLHVFPYDFQKLYDPKKVEVHSDKTGLKYVLHSGKKLFFKRSWPIERIQNSYSFLQCEQHTGSPHQYLTDGFAVDENSVVADAGAAEGIFALSFVEKLAHLYLFEADPEWIEALQATYAPWKEKVTIINKFISNKDEGQFVSLDKYFSGQQVDFLKIDVDGAETELLEGAKNILSHNKKLKLAICTYHRQQDEMLFGDLLKGYDFSISTSPKFMLFFFEGIFEPPYLRRGVIRAWK